MKCFILLTLLNPVSPEIKYPINIDLVNSMGPLSEYDSKPVKGTALGVCGKGTIYVRETWREIFSKPCIEGTGPSSNRCSTSD